jgi:hypothetical protein
MLIPVASIFWNFRFGFWYFDAAWGKGVKIELLQPDSVRI